MDEVLREHLSTFETFFNAIGFKSRLGRVWGLLALSGRSMSAAEITAELDMSAATRARINSASTSTMSAAVARSEAKSSCCTR
jgi:DNA-binding transcriptional regulator GbsR (MarR family)